MMISKSGIVCGRKLLAIMIIKSFVSKMRRFFKDCRMYCSALQPSPPYLLSSDLERRGPKVSLITDISLSISMERDVAAATE